jgi:hypothetical protein
MRSRTILHAFGLPRSNGVPAPSRHNYSEAQSTPCPWTALAENKSPIRVYRHQSRRACPELVEGEDRESDLSKLAFSRWLIWAALAEIKSAITRSRSVPQGRLRVRLVQISFFFDSVQPPPLMPRWATALNFVIPSVAEGPAVCLDGKRNLEAISPRHIRFCRKWNRRSLGYALSKNTSTKGPLNRRSLGCARDDKVEGSAPMESSCCMRAVFHLLGWADGP